MIRILGSDLRKMSIFRNIGRNSGIPQLHWQKLYAKIVNVLVIVNMTKIRLLCTECLCSKFGNRCIPFKVGRLFVDEVKCLLEYEKIKIKTIDGIEDSAMAVNNTLQQCKFYPGFPDINLITSISGQRYEKADCCSNMAFLTESMPKREYEFMYKNPIELKSDNVRVIRKLLESVNEEYCLVFSPEDNKIVAKGTIQLSKIQDRAVTVVQIRGHMEWRAFIGNLPLFEYCNGGYRSFSVNKFDKEKFKAIWKKQFEEKLMLDSDSYCNKFTAIIENVSELKHGTSIVIMETSTHYYRELSRITNENAGHGIGLKEEIDLFNLSAGKRTDLLSQITRIDGGLLLSCDGKCRAIGCIFDGRVYSGFKGDKGRGSRFNSIKLYVELANRNKHRCMGVIVSDDGYIDIIS